MKAVNTAIPDVKIIEPKVFGDERGFFLETFRDDWFQENCAKVSFVQDNQSQSLKGVLRGLHYQIGKPQGKLVRVVVGEVFDVAVDLRRSSPTFGHWVGAYLSSDNKRQLWIPPGFAHGFYALSNLAEFHYKCSEFYSPDQERCLLWDDPAIGIKWPLHPGSQPNLSAKDRRGDYLSDAETYP